MAKFNLGNGNDRFSATNGDDEIYGNGGADYLYALDGNDFVNGGAGDDAIAGGRGNDWLLGGTGNDTINGEDGNDTIKDQAGNDTSYGGAGDDTLEGGFGNDRLYGGAGHDTLVLVGEDQVTMAGGTGNDTYVLDGGTGSWSWEARQLPTLVEAAGEGVDQIVMSGDWDLAIGSYTMPDNIESLRSELIAGGSSAIAIHGNALDNLMQGSGYSDVFHGGKGNDTLVGGDAFGDTYFDILFGEEGNDTLIGEPSTYMSGGTGDDVYVVAPQGAGPNLVLASIDPSRLAEAAGQGYDTLKANAAEITLPANFERLVLLDFAAEHGARAFGNGLANLMNGGAGPDEFHGGAGNDLLYGEAGNDSLIGDAGDDLLSGGAGDDGLAGAAGQDALSGGDGNDDLWGGDGNDRLEGDAGDDTLHGEGGADTLTGGAGADRFAFTKRSDSTMFTGVDRITDFQRGVDRIDLHAFDADTTIDGVQNFRFVGAFSGHAGELRVAAAGGSTMVYGDVDGDGAADLIVSVVGVAALGAADFMGVHG